MKLPFINNKGEQIMLDDKLTIEQLVELGFNIRMTELNAPLEDGWYKEDTGCTTPQDRIQPRS